METDYYKQPSCINWSPAAGGHNAERTESAEQTENNLNSSAHISPTVPNKVGRPMYEIIALNEGKKSSWSVVIAKFVQISAEEIHMLHLFYAVNVFSLRCMLFEVQNLCLLRT